MTWRTDVARLCPRRQSVRSDSVGKGAQRPCQQTLLCAMRLCPPYTSMPQPAWTGPGLLGRLFIFFQHELTQIRQDIGDQHTPVGRRDHEDEVGKHLGHLSGDLGDIGVFAFQVALQQVVNLTVNALGHLSSFNADQRAGGSMSPLRSSAAFAGSAMNLTKAFATSCCWDTARRPTPTRAYSISSAGKGPRYWVPATGWVTLVCWMPISTSPAATASANSRPRVKLALALIRSHV